MSTHELRVLTDEADSSELLELLTLVASAPGFSLVITPDVKGTRDVLVGWNISLLDRSRGGTVDREIERQTLGWVEALEHVGELRGRLTAMMLDAPRRTR